MTDGVFCHISMEQMGRLVRQARRLVVIAAPGIDGAVASALVMAARSIGPDNVRIVLDVDEGNCRAGYGDVDGYSILIDEGIPIRRCAGLRIGFLLVDDEGYLFGMPPLMVEAHSKLAGCPNAVRATPEQIKALVSATSPPVTLAKPGEFLSSKQPIVPSTSPNTVPEIGLEIVSKTDVKKIEENIKTNPIQNFDLSRVVQVFNAHIQFVELHVEGAHLENHTIKLPRELLTVFRDKKTRDRLTAAFKLVSEGSKLTGDKVRVRANDIRKRFIRSNPIYGGVILKAKTTALEEAIKELSAELERHKKIVTDRFSKEAEKSKRELVQGLWRAVRTSPPDDLLAQLSSSKPTTEEAKAYLIAKLDEAFPDAEGLCESMKVTFVSKDVTWETLNNKGFLDWLAAQFPANKELKKPFEEYRAARQQLDMKALLPKAVS